MKDTYTKKEVLEILNGTGDADVKLEAAVEVLKILQTRYEFDSTSPSEDMIIDLRMHWSQVHILLTHVISLIMDASDIIEEVNKAAVSNEEKEQ